MSIPLKRNQIPPEQAENWMLNIEEEENLTFNLIVPPIVLQKETYRILSGENENRLRIYLGLEQEKTDGRYVLCAFAVSAFLMGSGDVFRDYENPVYKLERVNQNFSSKSTDVIESLKLYRSWRNGLLDNENPLARFRKYIYPKAYLLNKYELHEIFSMQKKEEAQIGFGISKTMHTLIYPEVKEKREANDQSIVFNFSDPCPPICDESSVYNTEK